MLEATWPAGPGWPLARHAWCARCPSTEHESASAYLQPCSRWRRPGHADGPRDLPAGAHRSRWAASARVCARTRQACGRTGQLPAHAELYSCTGQHSARSACSPTHAPLPAAEFYGELQGANYYSVAVVPASFCTPGVTLGSLRVSMPCGMPCMLCTL